MPDRSFWQTSELLPLRYLAWGRRNFHAENLPPCRHEGWVCLLIEEGTPEMIVDGKIVELARGAFVMIGPDCSFGWARKVDNYCKFILWMWDGLKPTTPEPGAYLIYRLTNRSQRAFQQIHEQCRLEIMEPDGATEKYLLGCRISFEALLSRLSHEKDERASQNMRRLNLADSWIREHLDSREPVARLCDYLNLSQASLYRLFKQEIGDSPAGYFRRLRMESGRKLLRSGEHQVKEIALRLGYSQVNDFSRAYRDFFGNPPSLDIPKKR
ncbi:helix-turn-helix domain-containing protein [Luteolibacter algae]|uniref:Helix-turn-helix domain-containing protein n=2 Tax=Luteolibacter algae TaxID=454151 RepID=A0ABW5DBW1_9BACT